MNTNHKTALLAASTLALALAGSSANASGFYLQDLSAKQAGNAYSGAVTAKGVDALWWNPASIAGITTKSASFGLASINPSGNVVNTGSVIVRPSQSAAAVGGNSTSKNPIANGILPDLAFAMPINDRLAFGVTVTSPFSFETNYDSNSWARYDAGKTRLTTIDIQPSLAYTVNDWLNVGVALNEEYTKATLGNKLPNLSPLLADGDQVLQGDGWNTGWTVGAQAHKDKLTVGLSYKSAIKHTLKGDLVVSGLLGPLAASNKTVSTSADFSTPSQAMVGVTYQTTPKLALHAQAISFGWSEFDAIRLGAPVNQSMPENYRDTVSFAVGGDYVIDPKWTVRAGMQYDQTPTRDNHRDARVPDANRLNYAVGTTYQVTPTFAIDGAFTLVTFDKAKLSTTTAAYAGTAVQTPIVISGEVQDANALVFSLGGHMSF